jgi:hypothetical protein
MAGQEKKELELDHLEVAELEDEDLENVSGGGPVTVNINCPCGGQSPQ